MKTYRTADALAHALIERGHELVPTHEIQGPITRWICNNYGLVTPETVSRTFRKMRSDGEVEVERVDTDSAETTLKLIRVGDVCFADVSANQSKMF